MIKCTEKNANTSHTRSQLELKVKACLGQIISMNYKILYKQEKKKKRKQRQCCLIGAAFKCLILLHLYLLQYVMHQF